MLERFDINPERTLRVMHAGIPGADRLFALLMEQVPSAQHVHKSDLIAAVAEMQPRSDRMRELIAPLLLGSFEGKSSLTTGRSSGPERFLPNISGIPICAAS